MYWGFENPPARIPSVLVSRRDQARFVVMNMSLSRARQDTLTSYDTTGLTVIKPDNDQIQKDDKELNIPYKGR